MGPGQTHLGVLIDDLDPLVAYPAHSEVHALLESPYRDSHNVCTTGDRFEALARCSGFHRHMPDTPDVLGTALGVEVVDCTTTSDEGKQHENAVGDRVNEMQHQSHVFFL